MTITGVEVAAFKVAFPAFSSFDEWPDTVITSALIEGDAESGGSGWGGYVDDPANFKRRGMFLFAAHWLASTYPKGASDVSAQSGSAKKIVSAKSVGDESVSYAVEVGSNGWLSSTSFGQQFVRLRRRAGMGARAV